MTPTPTPPCLGEREAVARALYSLIDRMLERELSRKGLADAIIAEHIAPLRTENETLRARAEAAEKVLVGQTPDGSEYHTKDADGYRVDVQRCARFITEDRAGKHALIRKTILAKNAAEAERDAAIARAEEAERKLAERPLTASGLADALGCFSNAAIGAMHSGTATECAIAQGIQAVAWRLEEISKETKT